MAGCEGSPGGSEAEELMRKIGLAMIYYMENERFT
jgi:hypothetical protein